jgi:preprotein translocase subunit YajC
LVIAIYLVILVAAFYFLIVRPQRRNAQVRRQLLATVDVGDEIVTSGGIIGTVLAIDDETLDVEIADGVVVRLARGAVAAKTNPAAVDEHGYEDASGYEDDEVADEDEDEDEDVDGGSEESPRES